MISDKDWKLMGGELQTLLYIANSDKQIKNALFPSSPTD